jgi:hypothetical protein
MDLPPPRKSHWLPTLLKVGFLLSFVCAIGGVMVMIARAGADGMATIDGWAASVRGGAEVPVSIGGPEAAAITTAVRASTATSYGNYLSQSDTACFSIGLNDAQGTRLNVLLVGDGTSARVAGVGIVRECECPDDTEPCHLP